MENLWIVASAAAETAGGQSEVTAEPVGQSQNAITAVDSNTAGKAPSPPPQSPYYQLIFIVVIFVVMYLIMFREPRKRQKQQQKMVQTLKKNDKVRTAGGIIGTIMEIKDDEVVVKVDESNNTKIRFTPSAIVQNLSGEGK